MNRQNTYRSDVQALRGIAVLLVVVFHAWPRALPGGYVGVDIFFVISGYLITRLLLREIERTGRIDFAAFYARRMRRLLPAATLVIATTAIVAPRLHATPETADVWSAAIAAACYVSNIWFAVLSVDYLQEGVHRNLLLHTWSLGVEEQFYLVWPGLLAASVLAFRRAGTRNAVAWMVAGITTASLIACLWLTVALPNWAFFGLPTRAWELGIGAAAALLESRARTLGETVRRTMIVAGLLGILVAALAFSTATRFPGHAALLPVVAAFLVVMGGTADMRGGSFTLPGSDLLHRLGDLSYSWYLWHWPVLIIATDVWPAADRNLVAFTGVALSLALAMLTYVAVENPVRRHAGLHARPLRTIALGLMLMLGAVGVAAVGRFAATRGDEANLQRKMERATRDRPRLYADRCFASVLDSEPPDCIYGAPGGSRTIALIGDSHAAQWFPAVERIAVAHGLRLAVFVKAACPVARVEPHDPKLNRAYVECTQWRERVFDQLARLHPVLVIGSNASRYEAFVSRDREAQNRWRQGLEDSLERLGRISPNIALIRDTPMPGFHVPACLARAHSSNDPLGPTCDYPLAESVLPDAFDVERAAVRGRRNVALIDLNDAVCASTVCPVEKDGIILFHDSQHISATFAASLNELLWLHLPETTRADLATR